MPLARISEASSIEAFTSHAKVVGLDDALDLVYAVGHVHEVHERKHVHFHALRHEALAAEALAERLGPFTPDRDKQNGLAHGGVAAQDLVVEDIRILVAVGDEAQIPLDVVVYVRDGLGRHTNLADYRPKGGDSHRDGLDIFQTVFFHPALEDGLESENVIDGARFRLEHGSLQDALFGSVQEGDFQGNITDLNT